MKSSQARDAFPKLLLLYGCGFVVLDNQAKFQTYGFYDSVAIGPDEDGNYEYKFYYNDRSYVTFTDSGAWIYESVSEHEN